MPNHTESLLTLKGSPKELERFLEVASGESLKESQLKEDLNVEQELFTFESFIPMPSTILRDDIIGNGRDDNNWYDWRIEHWGTKWDAYSVSIKKEFNIKKPYVKIYFQTAWAPVPKVIKKISEMFPELAIKYAFLDEGGGFCGWEKYKAGKLMSDSPDCFGTIREHLK
jgi:hypothetical protein